MNAKQYRQLQSYIQAVKNIIELIENDEDYMAIVVDPRFGQLQQIHEEIIQPQPVPVHTSTIKQARKGPSKAMKAVQTAYNKDVRMFNKPP